MFHSRRGLRICPNASIHPSPILGNIKNGCTSGYDWVGSHRSGTFSDGTTEASGQWNSIAGGNLCKHWLKLHVTQAMSKRVADHGHLDKPLLLFNRTYEIAKKHAGSIVNAAAVATIAEAVRRSDIIWSCLADDAAVRETYSELQNESLKGKLFVESSTISAETIRELGIKLADAGAEFVSMPGE